MRTFVDNVQAPAIHPDLQKLIHDANFIAAEGFKRRFSGLVSPTFVYESSNGGTTLTGYKSWSDFTADLRPFSSNIVDFGRRLDAILSEVKKLPSVKVVQIRHATAIHALPDAASASAGCVRAEEYKAVAEIAFGGTDWIRIEALISNDNEPIWGYVDRRDAVFS